MSEKLVNTLPVPEQGKMAENHAQLDVITIEKKKIKRKIPTSLAIYANKPLNDDDYDEVDYGIIQHENKRRKILKNRIASNKENEMDSQIPATIESLAAKVHEKQAKNLPDKLRTKYENIHTTTVQKLTTQAEQLRHEIQTLRMALANEKNTVKQLR